MVTTRSKSRHRQEQSTHHDDEEAKKRGSEPFALPSYTTVCSERHGTKPPKPTQDFRRKPEVQEASVTAYFHFSFFIPFYI